MIYHLLADTVFFLHLLFVLFAILGSLLVVRHHSVAWLHIPVVLWAAWIEFSGRICPLTPLENQLRRLSGDADYEGSFIGHAIEIVLYPPNLTRSMQMVLGFTVLFINIILYGWIVFRIWRQKHILQTEHPTETRDKHSKS